MPFATDPNPLEILRAPGYLYWSPTSLASEAGYGTLLGFCENGIEVGINYGAHPLHVEESGKVPTDFLFSGAPLTVSAILKNFSAATLARLFPGQSSSAAVKIPGSIKPGSLLKTSYASRLLFVPENTTSNPIFILQSAMPRIKGKFSLSRVRDTNFPITFDSMTNTDDADGQYYLGAIGGGVLR